MTEGEGKLLGLPSQKGAGGAGGKVPWGCCGDSAKVTPLLLGCGASGLIINAVNRTDKVQ